MGLPDSRCTTRKETHLVRLAGLEGVSEYARVFGGYNPLVSRGGTTFGNTFISRIERNDVLIDPREMDLDDYRDIMEHEGNHVRQYEILGPIGMGIGYGFVELMVSRFGLTSMEDEEGQHPSSACFNPFEWSTDYKRGNYDCE